MDNERRNQITAAVITLLILLLTLGIMVSCGLRYQWPPDEPEQVELKQDSILFGGEYVMLGDTPEPTESEQMDNAQPENTENVEPEPNVEGDDLEDAGEPAKQTPPPVVAKEPSPMKVKEKPKEEKPKKTGPAVETPKPPEKTQPKVKRGNDATTKTDRLMKDAFGKSTGNGTTKQGNPNGNASQGTVTGKPGPITGFPEGYTLSHFETTHSRYYGSVKVLVTVNTSGVVTNARAVDGEGQAWSDLDLRRRCEAAARKCRFSVPKKGLAKEAQGTIIYSLRP